jgi:hypothetical protein
LLGCDQEVIPKQSFSELCSLLIHPIFTFAWPPFCCGREILNAR